MNYRKKELDAVELRDELLLHEKDSPNLHRLNGTAAAIWKLCDGKRGLSDIAEGLALEFHGASREEIEADVEAALSKMRGLGLLDVYPGGATG